MPILIFDNNENHDNPSSSVDEIHNPPKKCDCYNKQR